MSVVVNIYRVGNWFHKRKMPFIGKIFTVINRFFFSTFLPSSASIGKDFKIGYWGLGVVIHTHTRIGNNVTISQNVTIGKNFGDSRVPVIGDDVYIGTGSVIFGNISIGNNTLNTILFAPSFCFGVIHFFILETSPSTTINNTGNNVDIAAINTSSLVL